jgi:hypothetical protein
VLEARESNWTAQGPAVLYSSLDLHITDLFAFVYRFPSNQTESSAAAGTPTSIDAASDPNALRYPIRLYYAASAELAMNGSSLSGLDASSTPSIFLADVETVYVRVRMQTLQVPAAASMMQSVRPAEQFSVLLVDKDGMYARAGPMKVRLRISLPDPSSQASVHHALEAACNLISQCHHTMFAVLSIWHSHRADTFVGFCRLCQRSPPAA